MPRLPSAFAPALLFLAVNIAQAGSTAPLPPDVPTFDRNTCPVPSYPLDARQRGEQGVTALGVLVGIDGSVRRVELLNSSGSTVLDTAMQEALGRCRFKPAVVQGQGVERWQLMQYTWQMHGEHPMEMLAWLLDVAATQGSPAAHYALYAMLSIEAAKLRPGQRAPEPARYMVLLQRSAAGGHCLAKHVLGHLHENGITVKRDLRQAREWYEQAAACGNPVAADRLEHMPASR